MLDKAIGGGDGLQGPPMTRLYRFFVTVRLVGVLSLLLASPYRGAPRGQYLFGSTLHLIGEGSTDLPCFQ
jgi:hypothetical protein